MLHTMDKPLYGLPGSKITILFDRDRIDPGTEKFDMFREPEKFRDLLVVLNMVVRGGMLEFYEETFSELRNFVSSPENFVREGTLDVDVHKDRLFAILYNPDTHEKMDGQILETIRLYLDQKIGVYVKSSIGNGKVHDLSVNGKKFDLPSMDYLSKCRVLEILGKDVGYVL